MTTNATPTARSAAPGKRRNRFEIARILAVAVVTSIVLGLASAPASADPRNGDVIMLACNTLGPVEIVVFSNGSPSPGLVVGSNQVVVPYRLSLTGTFTPNGGDTQEFTDQFEKPQPRNGRTDHCTFEFSFTDEFGTAEGNGTVSITYTAGR